MAELVKSCDLAGRARGSGFVADDRGTGVTSHEAAGGLTRVVLHGTDGRDALRLGGEACGGPVLDAATGAVLAVLGTALQAEDRSSGFAVALRAAAATDPNGPPTALLERNAATVPGPGADLNLAGALELTATILGGTSPPPRPRPSGPASGSPPTPSGRPTPGTRSLRACSP